MASSGLESFVNNIRNMYQNVNVNYTEVFNLINSHMYFFNESSQNLLDNVLPVFILPDFTLPHVSVLYSIVTQLQQQQNNNPVANPVNQDKLILAIENCILLADSRQVNDFFFTKYSYQFYFH
jgi:hypothetical protein